MDCEDSYFYTIVLCIVVLLCVLFYFNTSNTNERFEDIENKKNIEYFDNSENFENINDTENVEHMTSAGHMDYINDTEYVEHMTSAGQIDHIDDILLDPNEHEKIMKNIKNKLIAQLDKKINEVNSTEVVNVDDISFGDKKNVKIDKVNNGLRITSNSMDVQVDKICFDNGSFCMSTDNVNKILEIINTNYNLDKLNDIMDTFSSGTKLKLYENDRNTSIYSQDASDYIIYSNIYDAMESKVIAIYGSPKSDITTYSQKPLISKPAIKFGNNNETSGNGVIVKIPSSKYTLLWLQVPYNKWTVVEAKYDDGTLIGIFGDGFSTHNIFTPNGTDTDNPNEYIWFSIPIMYPNKKIILSPKDAVTVADSNIINTGMWVFAIGFSTNPWNHIYTTGRILASANNGGTKIKFENNNWKGYPLVSLNFSSQAVPNSMNIISVPVVPSEHDKILYILFHNDDVSNPAHTGISINGVPIDRFKSYNNVFSRHFTNIGGSPYVKYLATIIPKSFINKTNNFIKVTIDMSKQNNNFMFRFIGTHDNLTPQSIDRYQKIDVLPALQNNKDVSIVTVPKNKNIVVIRK